MRYVPAFPVVCRELSKYVDGISGWLDDCRIPLQNEKTWSANGGVQRSPDERLNSLERRNGDEKGRFPANLIVSDGVLDDGKNHKSGIAVVRTE